MSATIALDEIPGPRGLPLVGNAFDIDAANPIEGFMEMAGEYGPIFRLAVPGGTRLIVSGAGPRRRDLRRVEVRQAGRRRPGQPAQGRDRRGALHRRDAGPAVAARPQHPHVPVQPAVDARLHAQDGRRRRAADGQVVPAQPRRGGRRPGGHDPADPRHHRAVRVRLPVQLVLPRHPAPVRRGDGAHPRRGPDPGPAAADPDPAEDPGPAPGRGGPGVHERPGRPADRRAPGAGRRGRHHRPARPDAQRRRQGVRSGPARLQHPRAVHHLPHRRARDDLGAAVVRDLLPAQEPGTSSPGRGPRSTRCWAATRGRRSSRCTG